MADWKQITARIRRARNSKDPAAQLSALYEKTHDAMVAFELAKYFETTGTADDAANWYGIAADKFRRADWKTKAQEAAVRLGSVPGTTAVSNSAESRQTFPTAIAMPEPGLPFEQNTAVFESLVPSESPVVEDRTEARQSSSGGSSETPTTRIASSLDDKRRRRRGRRGGRNRRKASSHEPEGSPSPASPTTRRSATTAADELAPAEPRHSSRSRSMPALPVESIPKSGPGPKGRYGDPGLSSRISLMEMQFRRLLTCEAVTLEEADKTPVGPGVFVLTDSDLTSYYYVESCQTLRIAITNLLRGNSSKRGTESITKQLAEHLGIAESRVPKYLSEHCVVRWLQLDEGASHFAHFVIAVLRPILNE